MVNNSSYEWQVSCVISSSAITSWNIDIGSLVVIGQYTMFRCWNQDWDCLALKPLSSGGGLPNWSAFCLYARKEPQSTSNPTVNVVFFERIDPALVMPSWCLFLSCDWSEYVPCRCPQWPPAERWLLGVTPRTDPWPFCPVVWVGFGWRSWCRRVSVAGTQLCCDL